MSKISRTLRGRVRRRARGICEYCLCCAELTGQDFMLDHVVPEAKGGTSELSNLCWCCFWCNAFKHARTAARDPRTGHSVPLFNRRENSWNDHFRWSFPRWDDLLDAPPRVVQKLVWSGGLSGKKTLALRAALRKLRQEFGRCTLETARDWSDEKLEEFLCSLPEIQQKSAFCIMMYSFGRQVFPADTHVGRVLSRVGPYRELGLSLEGRDHKQLRRGATGIPFHPDPFPAALLTVYAV